MCELLIFRNILTKLVALVFGMIITSLNWYYVSTFFIYIVHNTSYRGNPIIDKNISFKLNNWIFYVRVILYVVKKIS